MSPRLRTIVVGLLGVLQVAATFGGATGQPERHGIDALAVVLLLVGPATLLLGGRWPLVPIAASAGGDTVGSDDATSWEVVDGPADGSLPPRGAATLLEDGVAVVGRDVAYHSVASSD